MRSTLLNQPIGIFDSGIGGLTVAQAVHQLMPAEDILYVADAGFMPYGSKTPMQVQRRCEAITSHLIEQGAKAIVVACNTATMAAIDALREGIDVPVIGVEPGVKPALALSQTGVIGVLATPSTIASPSFHNLCERQLHGRGTIVYQPCPELASSIEALRLEGDYMQALLWQYVEPLMSKNVDTLVLGCTHYAFVLPTLKQILPAHIRVVTTEQAVAEQVKRRTAPHAHDTIAKGRVQLLTSADAASLRQQVAALWPQLTPTEVVQHIF